MLQHILLFIIIISTIDIERVHFSISSIYQMHEYCFNIPMRFCAQHTHCVYYTVCALCTVHIMHTMEILAHSLLDMRTLTTHDDEIGMECCGCGLFRVLPAGPLHGYVKPICVFVSQDK